MNKLLVVTVLVTLLALNAESFRVTRQADEEEGTLSKMTSSLKSYYNDAVNTASGYLESVKGLKLEEKAKNLYDDTSRIVNTYAGILQDQVYYIFYSQQ